MTIDHNVDNSKNISINKGLNISKNIDNSKDISIEKSVDNSKYIDKSENIQINKTIVFVGKGNSGFGGDGRGGGYVGDVHEGGNIGNLSVVVPQEQSKAPKVVR